jgi:co-chaperonin GroES (HSP10)
VKEVIRPVAGKLVVLPLDDYRSPAGLILADTTRRPHSGQVLAVGAGVNDFLNGGDSYVAGTGKIELKAGSKIVYEFAAGNSFDLHDGTPAGYKVVVLKQDDVLGIVEEK